MFKFLQADMKTINLQDYEIRFGAFADILVHTRSKKALKLFKSYYHPALDGTGKEELGPEKTNNYRRRVFEIEFKAYDLVQKSDILKRHTPKFYGQIKFDKILNGDQDVSPRYLKDCCFEMEYMEGECMKLGEIKSNKEFLQQKEGSLNFNLSNLISEFNRVGVKYTEDSSAIFNSQSFTIIDFATNDPYEFEPVIGID